MYTLFAIIFLILSICDALLLYTYFAIISANMQTEMRRLFVEENGFLFVLNNLLHAVFIVLFYKTLNLIFFFLLLLSVSVYLFPTTVEKILKFRLKQ